MPRLTRARSGRLAGLLFLLACTQRSRLDRRGGLPTPWSVKPFAQWPQLLLTNEAHFDGHSSLYGASAFLVQNRRGVVLAATARHLTGESGGVQPEIPAGSLGR